VSAHAAATSHPRNARNTLRQQMQQAAMEALHPRQQMMIDVRR